MRVMLLVSWLVAVGLAFVAIFGLELTAPDSLHTSEPEPTNLTSDHAQPAANALEFPVPEAAVSEMLARSPFDPSRSPFTRDLPAPPPPPPTPPRLLGISMKDGKRSALLEWPLTGVTQRVVEGDATDLGKVASITASEVRLDGKEQLVVSLYR